jgi:DNA-binding MarR family transcriptional regulator
MTQQAHPEIDLFNLLNYKLWKLASAAGAPVIRMFEGRYGMSRQEWSLLTVVARFGAISPSELARQIALDRPRASKAVTSLINLGYLVRQQAPGAHRRYLLELTPKGLSLVLETYPQVRAINEMVLNCLDEQTRDVFEHALQHLTEHALSISPQVLPGVRANRRRAGVVAAEGTEVGRR